MRKFKASQYDKALILGNRDYVNGARQYIKWALASLDNLDSPKLQKRVSKLRQALKLLSNYNDEMVDDEIV